MIGTNVVVALGVIYSIFQDNFKGSKKDVDKNQSRTEQIYKKEDSVSVPKKTSPSSTHVADSVIKK